MTTHPTPQRKSRRLVLRGLGASMALPWLESRHLLAGEPQSGPEPDRPRRFVCVYMGDGVSPKEWTFSGSGSNMKLGPALQCLSKHSQDLTCIKGLRHASGIVNGHAKGTAGILTGIEPKGGRAIACGTSLDQLIAQQHGQHTVIPSMVLTCERPVSGLHDGTHSMVYGSHISWAGTRSPIPPELHPGLAFDTLFGSNEHSRSRLSILDHVKEQLQQVQGQVSLHDKRKIEEYATSIREVEQRLQRSANAKTPTDLPLQRPNDQLPDLQDRARIMSDILCLALQTDRTRIATLVLTNDLSNHRYPWLSLKGHHHAYSHSCNSKDYQAIVRFWIQQYAYLVGKLAGIQEGEHSLLHQTGLLFCNEHWSTHGGGELPVLLAGRMGGRLHSGRCLDVSKSKNRDMSSLLLSLAHKMDTPVKQIGQARELLPELG